MSLAEEFLAGFEEENFVDESSTMDIDQNDDKDRKSSNEYSKSNRIHSIVKLKQSILFKETMKKIEFFPTYQRVSKAEIEGPVEQDPEYLLVVDANNRLVEINNEIHLIQYFDKEIYPKRFAESEQLVPLPLDCLETVQVS